MIVVEEPAFIKHYHQKRKLLLHWLRKLLSLLIVKKDKKQNEYNKFDQNNEKVSANIESSTSGKKQPSVVTDKNKKKVQKKEFYSDESQDEVSDMMKRTP